MSRPRGPRYWLDAAALIAGDLAKVHFLAFHLAGRGLDLHAADVDDFHERLRRRNFVAFLDLYRFTRPPERLHDDQAVNGGANC